MTINELSSRYGKTQGNIISFEVIKGDEFFYNGNIKIEFVPSDNLLGYLEQNAARKAFLSLMGKKGERKLKGGKCLLAILAILLKINGVSTLDISKTIDVSVDELEKLYKDIETYHDDFMTYFEHIGLEEAIYLYLANMLGKWELSAGALLISNKERILVEHMASGHYSLPKGHVEESDASLEETAKREIKEELGLDAKIDTSKSYSVFYSPKDGVVKEVIFYLGFVEESELKLQLEEVSDAYFLEPSDAYRVLSYNSDREALQYLYKLYKAN